MRVTIDVDNSTLKSLMVFFNMRYRYNQTPEIRATVNGGFHFIVRGLRLTKSQAWNERALLGDDKDRLALDRMMYPGKPLQLLFRSKNGLVSTDIDERGLLAPPFWVSRIRSRERRGPARGWYM